MLHCNLSQPTCGLDLGSASIHSDSTVILGTSTITNESWLH